MLVIILLILSVALLCTITYKNNCYKRVCKQKSYELNATYDMINNLCNVIQKKNIEIEKLSFEVMNGKTTENLPEYSTSNVSNTIRTTV